MSEAGIIAVAMTFIIVSGGIDLSVGSTMGLVAIVLGMLWKNLGFPLPLAMLVALMVGGLCGAFNGFILIKTKMPPMIATLGTLALYRGLAEGLSQARSVRGYPEWFYVLGQGEMLGVPTQLWLLGALMLVGGIVLGLSRFGRITLRIKRRRHRRPAFFNFLAWLTGFQS